MFRLLPLANVPRWEVLEAHPLAEAYPHLSAEELSSVALSMGSSGYYRDKPIALFSGKILDGRNRLKAALQAGVEPEFLEFNGTDEEAEAFVRASNEFRRMLSAEQLQRLRSERDERICKATANGVPTRKIAEQEGVGVASVDRARKRSAQSVPGGTPAPLSPPPLEKKGWADREKVERYFQGNPDASGRQASRACGVPEATIRAIRKAIAEESMAPDREPGVEPDEDEKPLRPTKEANQAATLQALTTVEDQVVRLRVLMEEVANKHMVGAHHCYLAAQRALANFGQHWNDLKDSKASE